MQATNLAVGAVAIVAGYLLFRRCSEDKHEKGNLGIRVVCISDTHGRHRDVKVPDGDVLIHGGDYTHFGKEDQAIDMNKWFGELPHPYKIVVAGNHEANASWKSKVPSIFSNATYLSNGVTQLNFVKNGETRSIKIYGSQFYWPVAAGSVSPFQYIPHDTDVLINHVPAKGHCDGGGGCEMFLSAVKNTPGAKLVVGGHIHSSHKHIKSNGVHFVNASMCKNGYSIGWDPVVVDL
eukprot:TRINITY_DN7456_c0_g1_i1.p1 TRINITY_DN7456_c0_g1~~TRINITY_DN7456_c0_g1_i1.p1  ORF type:complete len:256 (+),score=38.68 TRINITY_DN7456_c0_g1_i1:65-769(+)